MFIDLALIITNPTNCSRNQNKVKLSFKKHVFKNKKAENLTFEVDFLEFSLLIPF